MTLSNSWMLASQSEHSYRAHSASEPHRGAGPGNQGHASQPLATCSCGTKTMSRSVWCVPRTAARKAQSNSRTGA